MTQTAWAHLPNSKHIDWVIASLKTNPEKWSAEHILARIPAGQVLYDAAWNAAYDAAYDAAYTAAYNAAELAAWRMAGKVLYNSVWDAAELAAWEAARDAAWDAACDSIAALIAWDDCGYMIESEIGELKIIAAFGNQPAILLLPACIVFNETKVLA